MTLSTTGPNVVWYSIALLLLLLLYSHIMTIAFGSQFGAFVHFLRSFYYLFGILLGILKFTHHVETDTWVLRVLFSVYMIAGNFILLNLFISVINDGLAYINQNPEEADFDVELSDYIKMKLKGWWLSLTGAANKERANLAKVRRGGPWNRELELYYGLLEEKQITPIEDKQALQHQSDVEDKSDAALEWFELANRWLSDEEKAAMPIYESESRNEHTARLAIRTIVWDMVYNNDKAMEFIKKWLRPKQEPVEREETPVQAVQEEYDCIDADVLPAIATSQETFPEKELTLEGSQEINQTVTGTLDHRVHMVEEEYDCLNEISVSIGPKGGHIEVMPDTWVVIDPESLDVPTSVRIQAYSTNLFASYVIQIETERPFSKPFKCCLPFKDGKRRQYCNVFVQRDDGPWTLTFNSVTCFSEHLRCLCHPKYRETKYRIAAKATQRKIVAKAGHTFEARLVTAPLHNTLVGDDQEVNQTVNGAHYYNENSSESTTSLSQTSEVETIERTNGDKHVRFCELPEVASCASLDLF